jgi:hypothetical protein
MWESTRRPRVLFAVTPKDGHAALEKIREALDLYSEEQKD